MVQLFGPSFEKNLIINNRELKYKGIFRADELFTTINSALTARGYTKREKRTEEDVSESGRQTYVELRPYKEKGTYTVLTIKIKITLDNVTEIIKDVNGKRKFQEGDIQILFDSWLLTDYENRWGMKPFVYFVRSVINKYLYAWPLEGSFPGELAGDTAYIYAHIKKLLRSYHEPGKALIKEEEVVKKVAEEISEEK